MQVIKKMMLLTILFTGWISIVFAGVVQENRIRSVDLYELLSRLDLNKPELERVRRSYGNPSLAAGELIKYYKSRSSVKHPVDRIKKAEMLGKAASASEIKMADNALKHIFVGQSAYPPVFCGEDINWGMRPVPDNEWVWQLNRMYFWDAMASAYWNTGDEKYAKEWCYQLVDWTVKNPNDKEHNYAWRSIEAGIRGNSWTDLYQYFIDSPHFTVEVLTAFLNSMYDHASYLMTQYRSKSNWGLMEAEGLAFIAITFPEFKDSEIWRKEAFRRLNAEITAQVYPDGYQRELATGYHVGCISWFLRTLNLARMNGINDAFPESYLKVIEKMCEVPMKLGFPDGSSTQFGDSWAGRPGQYYGRLREWADVFGRKDFLYTATEGREGTMPDSTAYAYPFSGFYSMRSGWDKDAICLVLKCGPNGGGHCQPDNGTFELYAGGRHLMPDAGSYIYSGDPVNRNWFRQTKVHQTLTLNGANSEYAPKLLLWKPGDDLDILVVENGSYPDLTHRRAVFFVDKKYFVIVDEALGNGVGDVDLHFQLAPVSAVFDNDRFSVRSDFSDGWNVMVQALKQDGMKMNEEEGQVSFQYTKKEPRPAFCYNLRKVTKDQGVRFVTVVVPYQGSRPEVNVKLLGKPSPGASTITLEVGSGGSSRLISYDLTEKHLKSWQEIRTVDDVCEAFPQRMAFLMQNLNLDLDGLKDVRAAYLNGNISGACNNLLDYYLKGNTVKHLRKDPVATTDKRDPVADSILQDIYTFYNQPDKISRDREGHLDWRYHGPADDIEWAWALNRHYHLRILLEAWLKTGNRDYSRAMDSHIKDWLISSLPYPGKKSSTELWRGLEVSFRVKIWARIFYNLINNEDLTPATRLLMLASLPEHAHYARNFHAGGNWLTMEMSGLATVATAWTEFTDSPAWLAYTTETMTKSLMEQVYPDGVQTELTSSYHQVALDNFNQFRETLLQANEPVPEIFEEQIEKMWNYQAYTMRPDGYGLLNNDADLIYNRDRIIRAADAFNRKDWLYIATNGREGIKPEGQPSNLFPYAGHLTMRSGYEPDAQWAFFDIGPWGTGHQHNDKLHISVSAYGRDLLVDGGRFAYRGEVADKFRRYATGSFSHNLVLVDGKGQAAGPAVAKEPLSGKNCKISKEYDHAWGSFDRFIDIEGECKHTRAVLYVRGYFWVVVDRIDTDRPRKIETLWHWHPDCKVTTLKKNIISTQNPEGNLKLIPVGSRMWSVSQVKGQEKPIPQGWYSREYNSAVPSTASIYTGDTDGNDTFVWILYPFRTDSPAIRADIISDDGSKVRLKVKIPGTGQWDLVIPYSDSSEASVTIIK